MQFKERGYLSLSARDVPFPGFFCAGNLLFLWRPPGADAIMKK